MSDAGPGPASFPRPRWIVPVAVIGALLLLLGVIVAIDWSGDSGGDKPVQITGTTTTVAGG